MHVRQVVLRSYSQPLVAQSLRKGLISHNRAVHESKECAQSDLRQPEIATICTHLDRISSHRFPESAEIYGGCILWLCSECPTIRQSVPVAHRLGHLILQVSFPELLRQGVHLHQTVSRMRRNREDLISPPAPMVPYMSETGFITDSGKSSYRWSTISFSSFTCSENRWPWTDQRIPSWKSLTRDRRGERGRFEFWSSAGILRVVWPCSAISGLTFLNFSLSHLQMSLIILK